ncbi:MAG: S8 family peptidase [Flavobacteriales bacterium]
MKKTIFALAVVIFAWSCNRDKENEVVELSGGNVLQSKEQAIVLPDNPLSKEEVDNVLKAFLTREHDFQWEWVGPEVIWSASHYGDSSIAIGYKPTGIGDISESLHTIDIKSPRWRQTHDALINVITENLSKSLGRSVDIREILVEDDPILPIITVKLVDRATVQALMNLENIRYIEPIDYRLVEDEGERSSSGCSPSSEPLNSVDYTVISPNALLPWNYNNHSIPAAWNVAQGAGITVGVLDAGISSSQALLNGSFNSGDSNVGRPRTIGYTLGTTAFTTCSHGTSMSATAVGPRNSVGATTGVAYRSGLFFVRTCNDVVLDGSAERTATKNALVSLGNNSSVRVISMSIGTPFSSNVLLDGLNYATGMGKLVMAAAGTSFSWTSWWGVIYPAAYSNAVAVTGVNESNNTCATCHDGSEVDFTVVMERNANDDRNSLALAQSGNTPTYIGGSSVATATAAGIAAMVWSVKPSLTRSQVLSILQQSSQYWPGQNSSKGYGNINALTAVNLAGTW